MWTAFQRRARASKGQAKQRASQAKCSEPRRVAQSVPAINLLIALRCVVLACAYNEIIPKSIFGPAFVCLCKSACCYSALSFASTDPFSLQQHPSISPSLAYIRHSHKALVSLQCQHHTHTLAHALQTLLKYLYYTPLS